ncbi:MAG TPA: formyl-CoA transferase, partial [Dehalococcoidia bacterium]|nr:formyl-CoA transferase [Dehalococcoidia bacterium]
PCSATFNAEDIYYDEHLREREMIVTIDHPERGEFMVPGCPVKLSDSPVTVTPAPLLGAHTAEVLSEFAGIDDARLAELRDASVV